MSQVQTEFNPFGPVDNSPPDSTTYSHCTIEASHELAGLMAGMEQETVNFGTPGDGCRRRRGRHNLLTTEDVNTIVARYDSGENVGVLAEEYSVSTTLIYREMRKFAARHGHVRQPRERTSLVTAEDMNAIVARYDNGESVGVLAAEHSVSRAYIYIKMRKLAVQNGRSLRPRGRPGRFTTEDVNTIVARYDNGESVGALAAEHSVSRAYIYILIQKFGKIRAAPNKKTGACFDANAMNFSI